MPRQQQIRKRTVTRTNSDNQTIGTGVYQSLDVQAERLDLSGLQRGLQMAGDFYSKKAAKQTSDSNSLAFEQGKLATSSGSVDEKRMAEDEFYRRGLNHQQGANDVVDLYSNINHELDAALQEDPNLDIDTFIQAKFKEAPQNSQDADYLKAFNSQTTKIESVVRNRYATKRAKSEEEAALNVAASNARALRQKSNIAEVSMTQEDVKTLYTNNSELGLSPEEGATTLVKMALNAAQDGDPNVAREVLTFFSGNRENLGKHGTVLDNAINLAERKQELATKSEAVLSDKDKALFKVEMIDSIKDGSWSMEKALTGVEAGYLSDSEFAGYYKKATAEYDKKIEKRNTQLIFNQIAANPILYHTATPEIQKGYVKQIETQSQDFTNTFVGLVNQLEGADPQSQDEIQRQIGGLFSNYKESLDAMSVINHTPRAIKSVFNSAGLDSPHFAAAAKMYESFSAQRGNQSFSGISEETQAQFRNYNRMVNDLSYTPQRAREILADKEGVTLSQASMSFKRSLDGKITEKIRSGLEDMLGSNVQLGGQEDNPWYVNDTESSSEVFLTPRIQKDIELRAAIEYKYSGDAEKSMETAIKNFQDSNMVVNGNIIPSEHVPKGFPIAFEGYQKEITKQLDKGTLKYSGDTDLSNGFTTIPIDSSSLDGRMLIAPVDDMSNFLLNEDGTMTTLNPGLVVKLHNQKVSKKKEADNKASFNKAAADKKQVRLDRLNSINTSQTKGIPDYLKTQL